MIKTVIDSENFRKEAFFMCGAKTGTPNQELIDACEAYLDVCENGGDGKAAADLLITQLENTLSAGADTLGANRVSDNLAYISQLLSLKKKIYEEIQ